MGLLGFLLFSLGVVVTTTSGSECDPDIAECSRYWVKMEPHKNLMESEDELNSWCRKQLLLYKCLENGLLRNRNFSDLPINFLISKMFSEDLCTEDSFGRKRYLNNAACINQLNTEYCTLPEYLDIVTADDSIPSRCSLSEKTYSCIATTIVNNCGFDAGRVYRYLLKLISYDTDMCNVEGSEILPSCEDPKIAAPKRDDELAEIFYGLVHRFGVIPEQGTEQDDPSVFSDMVESPVTEMDDSLISEVIRSALDNINEDSSEVYKMVMSHQPENLHQTTAETVQYVKNEDQSYRRTPIITEPFKGLLHYNYSGQDYAIYWRQPNDFPVENVECNHLLPSFLKGVIFRCLLYRRLSDPDCVYSEIEDEPITPELIRDIDPDVPHDSIVDFGPRPYWMEELDEYKRQRDLREKTSTSKFSASNVESVTESTPPAACTSETRIREFVPDPDFKWWKCPSVFSESLRKDIASVLLPDITEDDIPLMSAFFSNNVAYVYLYEARFHDFESVVCERVNECHPRGRGIFKCSVKPRQIQQCHNCYEESTSPSPAFDNLRNFYAVSSDSEVSSEKTDASNVESSGDSEYETSSDNLIALLLSRDATPVSDKAGDTEDIMAEDEDELVAIDISSDIPEHPQNDASSGVNFVIFDQDVKLPDDGSEIVSDPLYEVDGLNLHESDESYKLSSDDEYKLMRENVLLFQTMKPNEEIHAIYEMVTPDEHPPSQDVKV